MIINGFGKLSVSCPGKPQWLSTKQAETKSAAILHFVPSQYIAMHHNRFHYITIYYIDYNSTQCDVTQWNATIQYNTVWNGFIKSISVMLQYSIVLHCTRALVTKIAIFHNLWVSGKTKQCFFTTAGKVSQPKLEMCKSESVKVSG